VAHCDDSPLLVDRGVASRKPPVPNETGKTITSAGYADLQDGLRRALARSEEAFARRLGFAAAAAADQGDGLPQPPTRAEAPGGDPAEVVASARA
jgi:hypothetical protein